MDEKFMLSIVEVCPCIGSEKSLRKTKVVFSKSSLKLGRYSSGQRGQTVNLLTTSSQVRILLSPLLYFLGYRIVFVIFIK